ncbi:hypothetical protein D3C72_1629460 [compost metagenome]
MRIRAIVRHDHLALRLDEHPGLAALVDRERVTRFQRRRQVARLVALARQALPVHLVVEPAIHHPAVHVRARQDVLVSVPGAVHPGVITIHRAARRQAAIVGPVVARAVGAHRTEAQAAFVTHAEAQDVAAGMHQVRGIGRRQRTLAAAGLAHHAHPRVGVARGVQVLAHHAGGLALALMQRVELHGLREQPVVQVRTHFRTVA